MMLEQLGMDYARVTLSIIIGLTITYSLYILLVYREHQTKIEKIKHIKQELKKIKREMINIQRKLVELKEGEEE